MRKLLVSALTVAFVSIATIAAGPQTDRLQPGFIPHGSEVAAPPADAPKIDPSKVKFLLAGGCDESFLGHNREARAIVAREIDLSDDLTARQLLQMGITFVQETCRFRHAPYVYYVYLRPGDPATFTDAKKGFEFVGQSILYYPSDLVEGGWTTKSPAVIRDYRNFPQALKSQQAYYAEQERQRNAAREQQRQAEQRKESEIAARSAAFVKANGVRHVVSAAQLAANPFVYQGQVVAIYGDFEQMNSATQGLFSSRDKRFVVSGIPTDRFTQQRRMVMLAGRVLGNIEVKLPVLGPTLVPHLSFVGSAFCQQQGCSDYAFNLR